MMGISASPTALKTSRCCPSLLIPSHPSPLRYSSILTPTTRSIRGRGAVQCSSTPGPGSEESQSKAVLDAFFLGKAFAEALNERIGSTVGEVLSIVGQWQAEQQKQVQDFQEEVVVRANKARERAAQETMEQGITSKALATPANAATTTTDASLTSHTPTSDDPLQEMLKD